MTDNTDVFSLARSACLLSEISHIADGMVDMANGLVAEDRQTQVLLRLSHAERAQLHQEARDLGITLQALLERRVLGKHVDAAERKPGRKPKSRQQEALIDEKELMAS